MQMLFVFNAAFVAFLCLVQAARATSQVPGHARRTLMSTN
jgi:hypothetical protein